MNPIEKIKQNENTPIYLAFTLGILTGTIIGSNNNIENNEGCCKEENDAE